MIRNKFVLFVDGGIAHQKKKNNNNDWNFSSCARNDAVLILSFLSPGDTYILQQQKKNTIHSWSNSFQITVAREI
jgi:hypothetical protein